MAKDQDQKPIREVICPPLPALKNNREANIKGHLRSLEARIIAVSAREHPPDALQQRSPERAHEVHAFTKKKAPTGVAETVGAFRESLDV